MLEGQSVYAMMYNEWAQLRGMIEQPEGCVNGVQQWRDYIVCH
jgi:hypothetical protein